jgi:Flp pilus assembly protein TadB
MNDSNGAPNRPVAAGLHPVIYRIIIGLCVWFVCAVWGFAGRGYTGLALTVVSLFVAIAVLIPLILSRISRRDQRRRGETAAAPRILEWLSGDFEAGTGRVSAVEAAVEVLVPVAAAAVGMSSLALVLHLTTGA